MNKNKIEEVLESLDGCRPAAAPDFFYTRLRAKLEKGEETLPLQSNWLLRPAFAIGAFVVLLLVNVFVLSQRSSGENNNLSAAANDNIQAIAADYSLADSNYQFDYALEK